MAGSPQHLQGERGGLGAGTGAQLAHARPDVRLHRLAGYTQLAGYATGMFGRVGIQMWKGSARQSSQRAAAPEISVPIPCSLKNFP